MSYKTQDGTQLTTPNMKISVLEKIKVVSGSWHVKTPKMTTFFVEMNSAIMIILDMVHVEKEHLQNMTNVNISQSFLIETVVKNNRITK